MKPNWELVRWDFASHSAYVNSCNHTFPFGYVPVGASDTMESDHSDLNSKLNSPRVCFRELLGQPDYKEVHFDQPKVRNTWARFSVSFR